jgi:hypothetical protein
VTQAHLARKPLRESSPLRLLSTRRPWNSGLCQGLHAGGRQQGGGEGVGACRQGRDAGLYSSKVEG